jgi:hypothetical protein
MVGFDAVILTREPVSGSIVRCFRAEGCSDLSWSNGCTFLLIECSQHQFFLIRMIQNQWGISSSFSDVKNH